MINVEGQVQHFFEVGGLLTGKGEGQTNKMELSFPVFVGILPNIFVP